MARNFDGIQYEKYRKVVDEKFNKLHDELEECYYRHWKIGESAPWQGYDMGKDEKESKELFDKLHGLIWHEHAIALKAHHDSIVEAERDPKFQRNMCEAKVDLQTMETQKSVCELAADKRTELAVQGYSISLSAERI